MAPRRRPCETPKMALTALLFSVAWAAVPLTLRPVEWSTTASERPAAADEATAWARAALESAGHPAAGGSFELVGFASSAICQTRSRTTCEVAVRWTVREPFTGQGRYTVLTRGLGTNLESALTDAAARLVGREGFQAALASPAPDTGVLPLLMRACTAQPEALPAGMKAALAATVFVSTEAGTGSGVTVSPDGFVLTAAHVVAGQSKIEVRSPRGAAVAARLLAFDARQDVALLQVEGTARPCLPIATETAEVGTELYALGSPLGEALDFSVSKGIVSGARRAGDVRFLQTDASLNPGNSGGPLVGLDGRVLAVVSWKVAAEGLEGLGFGVPVDAAMTSLNLGWAEVTAIPAGRGLGLKSEAVATVRDTDDLPRLAADTVSSSPATAVGKTGFVLGGVLLGAAGASAVAGTWLAYSSTPTMSADEWTLLQVGNTVGWVALAGGAGLLVVPAFLDAPGVAIQGSF